MPTKRVLIAAAGTGGHVFPALAVAIELRRIGYDVHWLGTRTGREAQVVEQAGFTLHTLPVRAVRGKRFLFQLVSLWRMGLASWRSWRLLRRLKPDFVLGFGGYVTVPAGLAAVINRTPLILHEQNAIAGLSNRLLSRFAKQVFTGFPQTIFPTKTTYIGNPVRKEILALEKTTSAHQPMHLLIVGGSLGAMSFNEIVPKALQLMPETQRPQVWHQAGETCFDLAINTYDICNVTARVEPFIDDMASAYAWADLVICRAGALTVTELAAAGLPAIFVPFPYAVDDHQTANAQFLVQEDAAILMPQTELTSSALAELLSTFNVAKCQQMAEKAYRLKKPDVVDAFITYLVKES